MQQDIIHDVEGKAEAVIAALNRMHRQALVIRIGEGKKGDPYRYVGCDVVPAYPDATSPPESIFLRVKPWLKWWEFEQPDDEPDEDEGRSTAGDERNGEAADPIPS